MIPQNVKIFRAELSVYANEGSLSLFTNGATRDCQGRLPRERGNGPKTIHKVTKAWDEMRATWRIPWQTSGGDFIANPLDENNSASVRAWEDYDVTSAVQEFMNNPSQNHGFLLKHARKGSGVKFISSENTNQANRPKLTLYYEIDTEAPKITVLSPDGGEELYEQSQEDIKWSATDNVAVTSRAIYFSSDNGNNWSLIDSGLGNSGYFPWSIPQNTKSKTCLIKIFAYDAMSNTGNDASDAVFEIKGSTGIIPKDILVESQVRLKRSKQGFMIYIPSSKGYRVNITNMQGKVIYSFKTGIGNKWRKIPAQMSRGNHIIHIITPDGKSLIKKSLSLK